MTLLLLVLSLLVSSPLWAATRFAIPSGGATTGACLTEPTACTRDRAISQAVPGDTITLANGTYSGSTMITCGGGAGSNATNGTAGARITLKATNERQAFLQGDASGGPLSLTNCGYWTIDGLRVEHGDFSAGAAATHVVNCATCQNVTFRRMLISRNNRYYNVHLLFFGNSTNNVVEESEFYSFHRDGLIAYNSNNNIFRRNYFNSRGYADIPGGYGPTYNPNRGEGAIAVYPGSGNISENNISEGNGYAFEVEAYSTTDNNNILGTISLNDAAGSTIAARGSADSNMAHNTYFENFVTVGVTPAIGAGLWGRSALNTQCRNCSFLNPQAGTVDGVLADIAAGNGTGSIFLTNVLATNHTGGYGLRIVGQTTWGINYANAFGNSTNYSPAIGDSHITNSMAINPQMGTCYAWVPDGSPMKGAGQGGADIGANILYRYQDGVLTTTPLWDQNSGKFPCGAAVTGVNDIAGSSCFDVHQRLHINTGGCAFPAGYGTVTPPPTPIGNFALYTFDENSGTAAVDTSGQGHTLTLSSAGWGAPIIGVASLVTDGTRFASVPLAAGMSPATTIGLVGWWNGTTPATCDLISLGDSTVVRLNSNGTLSGFFFNGSGWPITNSSPVNLFDGQSHMFWMTKSPTELRVGADTAQLGSSAVTGTITYTLGGNLVIGKHGNGAGSYTCPTGRIDQVRLFDTELTPTAIQNLYNEQVPTAGLSVTHMGWFAPNAPEGVAVGAMDTNLNQLINAPLGVRWSIHKADAGTLTEYFRPFCRVLSSLGALVLDWTEITNSFGSTGIRFYADSVVTTGATTSARLPTDGFTTAPGVYLDNPVDISSPYDAPQRMTLSQAGHGELEMKIEFSSPRVAGERIECRPQRENGTPFTTYMGSLP